MTRTFEKNMLPRLTFALLAVFLVSCATSRKHGDTRLVDRKDIVWVMLDELRIQDIPLRRPSSRTWKIRDLPVGILPTAYYIPVPSEEASKHVVDQPWRSTIILIEAFDLSGNTIYKQKIDFSKDWQGASIPDRGGRRKIWISGTDWRENLINSQLRSYDLRITVLSPSRRASDSLQVEAMTRIQGDYL